MFNKVMKKLIASLAIAAMVVPMFSMTAEAAAKAPMYDKDYDLLEGPSYGFPNIWWDKKNVFYSANDNPYSGHKEQQHVNDLSIFLTDEQNKALMENRIFYMTKKCAAEADNSALPFIKVSTKDFLCNYGPMYGDAGEQYESCYFDSARYAADYPDVVALVGNTHEALWNHFKTSGIYEGRKGYAILRYGETTDVRNIYNDLADVWTPQMTDRELVIWVNKWLCDNMTYNEGQIPGKVACGVCGDYANTFMIIMKNLGIPCVYVNTAATGVNHAWNRVYIDGQWLTVDVTWNDSDQPGGIEGADDSDNLLTNGHSDYEEITQFPKGMDYKWDIDSTYEFYSDIY